MAQGSAGIETPSESTQRAHNVDIPEDQSCAVCIRQLPPQCTYAMLLSGLRGTGKIYSVEIKRANKESSNCTARVVFWDRQGLRLLMQKQINSKFRVGDCRPYVAMDDRRVCEQPSSDYSRVLRICGPSVVVNSGTLNSLFSIWFRYDLEYTSVVHSDHKETVMDWAFGSFPSQAAGAYRCIVDQSYRTRMSSREKESWEKVRCSWLRDPCE